MSAPPALLLQDVWKIYRTRRMETAALSGVDLRVEQNEFVSVVGASGSGKSTLVAILGLLEPPSRGRFEFFGADLSRASAGTLADARRAMIGFVFQAFHLIPDIDVLDNVAAGLDGLVRSRRERRERAMQALDELGLAARARHRPAQLSGGQQQRVAVARAMVREPALLICDEPTGNLDPQSAQTVFSLIETLHARGSTVILVTHDHDLARRARRTVALADGKVEPGGAPV